MDEGILPDVPCEMTDVMRPFDKVQIFNKNACYTQGFEAKTNS